MQKLKMLIDLVATGSLFLLVGQPAQADVPPDLEAPGIVTQVPTIKDVAHPATSLKEWLAQDAPPDLVQVTGVRLNPTLNGLEVILVTSAGLVVQPLISSDTQTVSADIADAVLALPEGKAFQVENPTDGVAAVSLTQRNSTTVRVSVTGVDGAPTAAVKLGDCPPGSACGLTLSLTLAEDAEEEIIVTAEKRPENPQQVPISLTVLGQQQLQDADVNSIRDVAALTPNFFTSVGDRSFNFQTIRGLGNSNYLSRDAISVYIDDVPYENIHQLLPGELFDLERVEVLRGPQGTLYGRSSQAGVVNIISRPPTNFREIRIGGGYGNYNQRQVQLSVSDALIEDKLAFRFGGAYSAQDGFTENVLLGEDANPQDSLFGRASILWTPAQDLTVSFNAFSGRNQDGDNTFVPITQADRFRNASNIPGSLDVSINTQALKIAYEGAEVNVTSITARNQTGLTYSQDTDYTPEDLLRSQADIPSTIWSQEIRVQSPKTAERFRWLVGGYYQSRSFDLFLFTEYTPLVSSLGFPVGISTTDAQFQQYTYAVFGQVEVQPIKALTLTAGLRYERFTESLDRNSFFKDSVSGVTPTGLSLQDSTISGNILLPRLAIQYRFNPNFAIYGSAARGYKPGTQNFSADTLANLFVSPEKLWSYEVGLKSTWLNNRITANLALFWSNVDDYQVLLTDTTGLSSFIANGGVTTKGLELELSAKPLKGLDLMAGFGYTDARFTEYTNPLSGQNFNGNRLTYAPEFTLNLGVQYRSPSGFFGRVDVQGIGTYFFDDANILRQNPLALVNTRIGYEWKQVGIYFFVNNIFDKEYITTAFSGIFADLASYGNRRTFGVQVRSTF
ncbi:MAG: TonB-dependent receptor [Aphanocapsa sp. GSE-SYN-MK-11-07L]|jgi:iron complex outermembrane receptor protein|nr:TonB-dependent receptor [Aphanocapsa sp. GSE-SYN-MK-11-07L]